MQALFLFLIIFFGILGALFFIRILYNAFLQKLIQSRKEHKRDGK